MNEAQDMIKLAVGFYMPRAQFERDMEKAQQEYAEGKYRPAREVLDELAEKFGLKKI